MSQLLVSIKSLAECQVALSSPVNIIDIKDPAAGSLGMADPITAQSIVRHVRGRRPMSIALGELRELPAEIPEMAAVNFAKLGLSNCRDWPNWPEAWKRQCQRWPDSVHRVAVAYADASIAASPAWPEVLAVGERLDCRVLLIDTYDKRRGRLLDWMSVGDLQHVARAVAEAGMQFALAGSLTPDEVARLANSVRPDLIAVRTAACDGGRNGHISERAIRELASRILPTHLTASESDKIAAEPNANDREHGHEHGS